MAWFNNIYRVDAVHISKLGQQIVAKLVMNYFAIQESSLKLTNSSEAQFAPYTRRELKFATPHELLLYRSRPLHISLINDSDASRRVYCDGFVALEDVAGEFS
jgi:hypothetical protein